MTNAAFALLGAALLTRVTLASNSADELVRQAQAHEAAREPDVAVRRYMEALAVEPTHAEAWLGLGALRSRLGEPDEAERVYTSALERLPSLRAALEARAHVRWALGRHAEAEDDLDTFASLSGSTPALRELAAWYARDGRAPAQLATWRRLLSAAVEHQDAATEREARRMVRALVILVDGADPASSPPDPDAARRALSAIARRGG